MSFYDSWLSLDAGRIEGFHTRLPRQNRIAITLLVLLGAGAVFLFLEPTAALLVVILGVWALWHPKTHIHQVERKLFLTLLDALLLVLLAEKVEVFLHAFLFLALAIVLHVAYVWRRP